MDRQRILIVDDDFRIGRLVSRVSRNLDYEPLVLEQTSGFLYQLHEFMPDVVIVDLKIGEDDGVELLYLLAEQRPAANVLILSGAEESIIESAKRYALSVGLKVLGSLQKPFDIEALRGLLAQRVSEHALESKPSVQVTPDELERALEEGGLEVFYQPKVTLRGNVICGLEALVRWRHERYGLLSPDTFIPLAEETGLIVPLTFEVLEQGIRDIELFSSLYPDLSLAVNLSATMLDDQSLLERIVELLQHYDFPAKRLVLEVTESAASNSFTNAMKLLTRLRLKGIAISIDDFGTGYSSLNQLFKLPYSEIKVDREFVSEMTTSREAAAIVHSTITLGHRLGVYVVAEGIEDRETAYWLSELGCHAGQGYYFSPPVPAEELGALLATKKVPDVDKKTAACKPETHHYPFCMQNRTGVCLVEKEERTEISRVEGNGEEL